MSGPTSNMQLLGGLEQVLAQFWRQCGEEAAVDQPGQGGIQDEAQQRLGHRDIAILQGAPQLFDLKLGLAT